MGHDEFLPLEQQNVVGRVLSIGNIGQNGGQFSELFNKGAQSAEDDDFGAWYFENSASGSQFGSLCQWC